MDSSKVDRYVGEKWDDEIVPQLVEYIRIPNKSPMFDADWVKHGYMDDAVRLNAAGVGIQVFIGGEHETRSLHNMTKLVDAGLRCGMPVMGVTAVGKNMVRDAQYFRLACRIIAELGAQYVKTYYVDDGFDTVTASCPVPIVMAGGKKLPELDALTMAYNAVQQGAAGVDMGRNIFQSDAPKAMIAAVNAVVHKNTKPAEALDIYRSLKSKG